jgi:hypothetical protein
MMATLATQPVTLTGLDLAHAAASPGGDRFTPAADTMLHLANTGPSTVTVTVASQQASVGQHVDDVTVTVPAGAAVFAGPFPPQVFAHPADGTARITYSATTGLQVAAIGMTSAPRARPGTILTLAAGAPADLPSGSAWATSGGDLYVTPSPTPPGVGATVTSGSTAPTDLPDGTIYVQVVSGVPVAVFLAAGISAADVRVVSSAPADLAANQIAVVLGADGTPTDLYVGGLL